MGGIMMLCFWAMAARGAGLGGTGKPMDVRALRGRGGGRGRGSAVAGRV